MLIAAVLLGPFPAFAGAYEDMLNAVSMKDTDAVYRLLQRGMDVNTTDPMGSTLLMLAAQNADIRTLEVLLRYQANVLKINKYGDTALMLAALRGSLQGVAALVAAGAEISPAGWTPLIYAAFEGHGEVVSYLLTLGIDVDAQSATGTTALMAASRNNHPGIVKILLEHQADVELRNQDGMTAANLAMAAGCSEIVALLRGAGALRTNSLD